MPPFGSYSRFRTLVSTASRRLHASPARPQRRTPRQDEVGPMACRLGSRSVVRFRGADTAKFLQGLLTNDVRPLARPSSSPSSPSSYFPTPNVAHRFYPPVYAALLTPQGRFLYDLFLYRPPPADGKLDRTGCGPGSGDEEKPLTLLADVDAAVLDELLDCFKK